MWCSTCQQDVPGIAHAASRRIVCSRCQQPLGGKKPAHAERICDDGIELDEPAAAAVAAAPPRLDEWSARQRVRDLGRELRRPTLAVATTATRLPHGRRRFDPPQNFFDQLEHATAPPAITPLTQNNPVPNIGSRHGRAGQYVAWLVVLSGSLALAAGIGLIAWSLAAERMIHWNLALGLALGGQGTLILGLALVVSRLWRNSRYAMAKLHDVHASLGQLQQTADAITAMRCGGAPAFYADLVRGASPQVLLANLKGQLDQLATRLASGW